MHEMRTQRRMTLIRADHTLLVRVKVKCMSLRRQLTAFLDRELTVNLALTRTRGAALVFFIMCTCRSSALRIFRALYDTSQ